MEFASKGGFPLKKMLANSLQTVNSLAEHAQIDLF